MNKELNNKINDYLLYKKKRNTIIYSIVLFLCVFASVFVSYKFFAKKKYDGKSLKSIFEQQYGYAKPVLYLYPKKETKITVTFEDPTKIKTSYPKYKDKWKVTANSKGNIEDKDKNSYYALYWEEEGNTKVDFKQGYYVTKEEAITFLEDKLKYIGLNDRERNEFIIYWLPVLETNEKSIVYFELTEERDKYNKINISPKPDSLLRVAIHIKKVSSKPSNLEKQKLSHFNRKGFSAIEWGGVVHE